MEPTALERAEHVKQCITDIRTALNGKTFEEALADHTVWRAFERCLEIISEASRKLPQHWKDMYGAELPWHDIANSGNILRHAYHQLIAPRLWNVYVNDLDALEAAIDAMLAAHATPPPPSTP